MGSTDARARTALLIMATACLSSAKNCCPDDMVFFKETRSCDHPDGGGTDFIQRDINCTSGMYLVDPLNGEEDEFVVLDDGYLEIGKNVSFSTLVPPHMFCVTRAQTKEGGAAQELHQVAFVCFPGVEETSHDRDYTKYLYYGILEVISTVFLFVTILIYILIPELRDLQGKCIMSTVLCQMFGYLILACMQFRGHLMDHALCVTSAFFLYFWMLSSFFWLSVTSFNVWRSVRYQRFPFADTQLFWFYSIFGWLCPIAFLVAALATHHWPSSHDLLRPNFGLSKCWFHGDKETIVYFYVPISVLLTCNIVFFVLTAMRLWKMSGCENTVPGLKASRFKCLLYLKVFVLMGILWIFEVISFLCHGYDGFWHITDSLNSLQGVFMFLIVVCRKRVIKALKKREWGRTMATSLCPKQCTTGPDEEQEEAMLASAVDDDTVPMDAVGK